MQTLLVHRVPVVVNQLEIPKILAMKIPETPYLFFTGKGGVGKTSLSCATAINLAGNGKKVLLVSTDPVSNLQDVLQSEVYDKINAVSGVENLWAINIDPEISAEAYR